jgi:ankyrin repeat protein
VKAILNGDKETVAETLRCTSGLLKGEGGWEPLIAAARKGHVEITRLLLKHGAYPDASPWYGKESAHTNLERSLHWACDFGRPEVVRLLLDRGADVEGCQTWRTPLLQAARTGRSDIVAILESAGARPHFLVDVVLSPVDQVRRAIDDDALQVAVVDEYGTSPIHLAAELWRPDIVELLLSRGGNAMARDAHEDTPLHLLAIHPQDGVLWWGDKRNEDFAERFSEDEQIAVGESLVANGADVGARNWRMLTPLHRAVRAVRARYVSFLLDHGADINAADIAGDTPLRRAVTEKGRVEMARLLIDRGADVGAVNKRRSRCWIAPGAKR